MYDLINATSIIIEPDLVETFTLQTYLLIMIAICQLFLLFSKVGGWILSSSAKY